MLRRRKEKETTVGQRYAISLAMVCLFTASWVHAGDKFGLLNSASGFGTHAFVDENSRALGFSAQESANYLWSLLEQQGVPVNADSATRLQVSVYSLNLRSLSNPAIVTNTMSFVVTLECSRRTREGMVVLWRDFYYGGYTGVTAEYIIKEISQRVGEGVKQFATDYHSDRGRPANTTTSASPVDAPSSGAPEVAWKEFVSESGSFSVSLPGTPEVTSETDEDGLVSHSHIVAIENGTIVYIVTYADFEKDFVPDWGPQVLLNGAAKKFEQNVRRRKEISLDGFPGMELVLEFEKESVKLDGVSRMFVVGGRLYQVMAMSARHKSESAQFVRFLDSFRLLRGHRS